MTTINSRCYTSYQKRVIKAVTPLIGDRAFYYTKAKNNHLELKIEGIDKPLYTGATPSDCKSFENFMSQVRSKLRASEDQHKIPEKNTISEPYHRSSGLEQYEKIVRNTVKHCRTNMDLWVKRERDFIIEQNNAQGVNEYRQKTIKEAINKALSTRRNAEYVTESIKRSITKEISHHINFMLPNSAYYSDILAQAEINKKRDEDTSVAEVDTVKTDDEIIELEASHSTSTSFSLSQLIQSQHPKIMRNRRKKNTIKPNVIKEVQKTESKSKAKEALQEKQTDSLDVFAIEGSERVQQLKKLTSEQAQHLLVDLQQAITEKHEDDLKEVISLIEEKGLNIQEIMERMQINNA